MVDLMAIRNRTPLFGLMSANAISMVGNVFSNIAIPWFVLETTGSASKTGLTAFFALLPAIVAGFFGGALVDRLGYRRMSIIADLASGVTVAIIPLLYMLDALSFGILLTLVFLGALLDAPGATARTALVPELAALAGTSLERATASMQVIQRGSFLLGAPLAGVMVAIAGTSNVLWFNAASFVVSALLIGVAVPAGLVASEEADAPAGYITELLDGVRYILTDPLVRAIVLTVMITNFLDAPLFAVVMPVYANEVFDSSLYLGLMFAAFAGGAVAGTVLFGAIGEKLPRRATFISSFIVVGLPFWVLAALPPLPVIIVALCVSGIAAGPLNPLIQTVAYERVPANMRGRIFGALSAGVFIAMPFGVLLAGYVLEWLGLQATLVVIAACYLVVTTSMFFSSGIRQMDQTSRHSSATTEEYSEV